jgi:hypothetical protein
MNNRLNKTVLQKAISRTIAGFTTGARGISLAVFRISLGK